MKNEIWDSLFFKSLQGGNAWLFVLYWNILVLWFKHQQGMFSPQNVIKSLFFTVILSFFNDSCMVSLVISFLSGSIFCYNTMCSFAIMTAFIQSIFFILDSCCVTALTNCSSHSEEPVHPLSVSGIRGTLSTLRFYLRDVSQLQQKRACPNTDCGPLCGERIGLFTASHHFYASSAFQFVWWPQSNIL